LICGAVSEPREWCRWNECEAYLRPAADRGGFESVLDPDEHLFVVMDGDELLCAATAWLSDKQYVEVKLVGGRDHRRWLKLLDDTIGAAAAEAGATRMIGIGRAGWSKILQRQGWAQCQSVGDNWLFERELKVG
jgi:hypothetical protein